MTLDRLVELVKECRANGAKGNTEVFISYDRKQPTYIPVVDLSHEMVVLEEISGHDDEELNVYGTAEEGMPGAKPGIILWIWN